jgi:signal transduction histidine kinase
MVEDSEDDAILLARELKKHNFEPSYTRVESAADMKEALQNDSFDIVICDFMMPGFGGMEALKLFKEFDIDIPFILVSGKIVDELAIEALRAGAGDFITKQDLSRLHTAIIRELEDAATRAEKKRALEELVEAKKALEQMNETLAENVRIEVAKNRDKDALLVQQSRLAIMGEMLSAIAHHWRQPLNALGLIIQDTKGAKKFNELTEEYLDEMVDKAMTQINSMSKTIDNFRGFFKSEEKPHNFLLRDTFKSVTTLLAPQLESSNIEVLTECDKDMSRCDVCDTRFVCGYQSELKQVLLNILLNSKDAILDRQKKSGKDYKGEIHIKLAHAKENNTVTISISDNGGGIEQKALSRIFEPYFSTKEQGKGIGIGLYMSKIIIERNFGGKINAQNITDGAQVTIELPLPVI